MKYETLKLSTYNFINLLTRSTSGSENETSPFPENVASSSLAKIYFEFFGFLFEKNCTNIFYSYLFCHSISGRPKRHEHHFEQQKCWIYSKCFLNRIHIWCFKSGYIGKRRLFGKIPIFYREKSAKCTKI